MRLVSGLALVAFSLFVSSAAAESPVLAQQPALSQTQIVFVFAGDLWSVPRTGGDARRLTTGSGVESNPSFSPDGNWIAFTGQYDGNTDVFVVAAQGGVPRRLTWHPDADIALGWTRDGKKVLFSIAEVMAELQKNPVKKPTRPAYPNYHKKKITTTSSR